MKMTEWIYCFVPVISHFIIHYIGDSLKFIIEVRNWFLFREFASLTLFFHFSFLALNNFQRLANIFITPVLATTFGLLLPTNFVSLNFSLLVQSTKKQQCQQKQKTECRVVCFTISSANSPVQLHPYHLIVKISTLLLISPSVKTSG